MMQSIAQAAKSAGGSFLAFAFYLSVSAGGDLVTAPEFANGLGLVSGAAANFLLQKRAFGATLAACSGGAGATLVRYWLAEFAIVASQQGLFVLGLHALLPTQVAADGSARHLRMTTEESLLYLRVIAQVGAFFAISFPLRKYWVFRTAKVQASQNAVLQQSRTCIPPELRK
mmetsp:Transcript_145716/g.254255  ORF Transcript_145716/g.254255 Transcript_145716/m.254255 type:complete len:172 (-) Transcript_145716:25-540(-)